MGEGEEPVHPERLPSQHPRPARPSGPLTRNPPTSPRAPSASTPPSSPTDTIRTKRSLPRRAFPLLHGGDMGRPLALSIVLSLSAATLFAQQPSSRGIALPKSAMPTPNQMMSGAGGPSVTPPTPKAPQPEAPVPPATPFDSGSLDIKYQSGSWQLWAGRMLIKDFGRAENEAREALRLLRELRVNARGVVGGVFEFWLADGEAPSGIVSNRKIISFNPAVLRVEQVAGAWSLRDDHVVLYNFGPSKADAETALSVCRRYGFNQLGFVGQPTPNLKYLMVDKNAPSP